MILPFVLVFMLVTPLAAIFVSQRTQQLMAPAVGALDLARPVRGDAGLRGSTVAWRHLCPLVRLESVRLVRHPAVYLVAIPFTVVNFFQLEGSEVLVLDRDDVSLAVLLAPYGWGVLIASNLLTLRSRRWRSEELLATMPVPQRSRTAAHLVAPLVTLPGAAVLLAGWFALAARSDHVRGTARPAAVLAGVLIVVGGGCVGVAVARWLPRPLFGWLAVIVTIVLQVNFGALDPRWRWLHFSVYAAETISYPRLAPQHHEVHLLYLAGGVLLVAAVALARDGLDRRSGALGGTALAVLLVTGAVQTAPLADADTALFVTRLEQPGIGQTCRPAAGATVCADPGFEFAIDWWTEPVVGVLRRVPDSARPADLVIRQRALVDARALLHPEIASAVDPAVAWPDDREVSVSDRWRLAAPGDPDGPGRVQLALAYRTASALVGLPPDAWWSASSRGSAAWATVPLAAGGERNEPVRGPLVQCDAAGDGRAVVAAWLAGQSTPAARAELRRRAGEVVARQWADTPVAFDPVDNYLTGLPDVLPEQGAVPSGGEILAATALLDLDDALVAAAFADRWSELVAPGSVPTATVLGWLGSDPSRARAAVAATAPRFDPEIDPDADTDPPVLTGTCPRTRR